MEISCFARMMHVMMDNSVIGCKLREMVENKDEDEMLIVDLIHRVVEDELEEEEDMSGTERSYLVFTVFSRILCFAMYQLDTKRMLNVDCSTMREMVCRDVCKSVELYRAEKCKNKGCASCDNGKVLY